MDRYVAFLWDSTIEPRTQQVDRWSAQLKAQSPKWTTVLDLPGLRVHSLIHRGDAPIVTAWPDNNGVIVGPVFRRGDERKGRIKQLSAADAERIAASNGDALVGDWWGNYVAVWRKRGDDGAVVIRDPCGAVPGLMTEQMGVQVLFAHADDIAALPGVTLSIDWTYLQAFLLLNFFVTKYTGFREVTELLSGERLHWTPRGPAVYSWAWNAVEIASAPNDQPFDDAASELRATAEACFTAWGNEYRRMLVSVSGGLDSSILLNLLRSVSDAEILAVHYRGFAYEDYETGLARLAANRASVELLDLVRSIPHNSLRHLLEEPVLARPHRRMFAVEVDRLSEHIADQHSADAFVIGQGGDHLFFQRGAARHTLTDFLLARREPSKLASIAYEAAMLRREAVSTIVRDTISALIAPHRWDPLSDLHAILNKTKYVPIKREVIASVPTSYQYPPWLQDARALPTGKAIHVAQLISLYNYHVRHGRALRRDVCHPYISQPLFEFALRTPVYRLVEGGVDRALQRHAFADLVPDTILRRTAKGGADHYSMLFMQRSMDFIQRLVREGHLVKTGWLDIDKLEAMLSDEFAASGQGSSFLQHIAIAEAWLRTCSREDARLHA